MNAQMTKMSKVGAGVPVAPLIPLRQVPVACKKGLHDWNGWMTYPNYNGFEGGEVSCLGCGLGWTQFEAMLAPAAA